MGYLSPLLAVRNMKETIEFYKNTLGFKMGMAFPNADNPEYADLSKDGMVLMFVPAKNVGIGSEEKLGIGVNLYMEIDGNIDKYYAKLKSKGVKIVADIKDEPFDIRDFTVEDPDGYQLTFNRPIKAVIEVRMESFVCEIYLDEIHLQCVYALRAFKDFNVALQRGDTEERYRAAHSYLTHVSNVSRLLWPPEKSEKVKHRGAELRSILGLPDEHILKDRKLRNHLEHYDTRLDAWADSSPHRIYVDRNIGPKGIIGGDAIQDSDIMRHIDPGTLKFIFRGEEFELQPIATAIEQLADKAKAAVEHEREQRRSR